MRTSTIRIIATIAWLLFVCVSKTLAGEPEIQDMAFKAENDQTEQHYMMILPKDFKPQKTHDVLMGFHGHGFDRKQYATDPAGQAQAARDVAAKHSMIFISPDYRAPTSWMGPKAEADILQIIKELKAQFKVGRVFLVGGSMGGTSVLTFAALHPDLIAGVASQNGTANHLEYDNFQDAIRESFGGTKAQVPDEYKKRSAEFFAERLTMPIAIAAGGKDTIVPPQSVLRLAARLKELNHKIILTYRENGGHSTSYEDTVAGIEYVIQNAAAK